MRASWYDRPGDARTVLQVGEMPDPLPGPGELRFRVAASGINPGDVKKRGDAFRLGMAFPRIIPHSDGAGVVDAVGPDVPGDWIGRNIWCYGAQSYRPFGTAAEYCVIPVDRAVEAPPSMSPIQGACLGIPGLTAHRAVHAAGPVDGRTVLVQGGVGAVGLCAVQLAHRAGARVLATVSREDDVAMAVAAGAEDVVLRGPEVAERILRIAPDGVDHVVEVAFSANIAADVEVVRPGGTVGAYATTDASPSVPFWPLAFKNVQILFLGSDDFSPRARQEATEAINDAFIAGWSGFPLVERLPLDAIAEAHECVEQPRGRGRVVVEP